MKVFQDSQAVQFRRFTDAQIRAFFQRDENQDSWSLNTSGVCLDLHTDAATFQASAYGLGQYELLLNGQTVFCRRFEEPGDHVIRLSLPRGDNRIMLVLPNYDRGSLTWLELTDARYVSPHFHRLKLAFHGDSITQGFNSAKDSPCYAWLISRNYDAQMLNLAIPVI